MNSSTSVNKRTAFWKAFSGLLIMAFGLGTALALADAAEAGFGISLSAKRTIQAVSCSLLAVPVTLYLWLRIDRGSLGELGLTNVRKSLQSFGLGTILTLGPAVLLFGIGWLYGWIHIHGIESGTYLLFVIQTIPIAFFYEALPEEITLRGYSYRHLNTSFSRRQACFWTTVLFLLMPATASLIQTAAGYLFGMAYAPAIVPPGQEPVAYFILLVFFGVTLLVARIVTGSLWASIGVHLSFLITNRTLLESGTISGWEISLASENVLLLIPAYLMLSTGLFLLIARFRGVPLGWKENAPNISAEKNNRMAYRSGTV